MICKYMRTIWIQHNYSIPQNCGFTRKEAMAKAIEMLGSKREYEKLRRIGAITITKCTFTEATK
jgi:hypothetical protein